MLELLKLLDARLREPSSWVAIGSALVLLHVKLDPGLFQQLSLWGVGIATVLGIILAEAGSKPNAQIAIDAVNQVAELLKPAAPSAGPAEPPPA